MPAPNSAAVFFGLLTQSQKEEVLKQVAVDARMKFDRYMKALRESVGLPQLSGQERLNAFRQRQQEVWAHLQTAFPLEYEKQLVDWRRLETAAMRNPNYQHAQEGAIGNTNVPGTPVSGAPSSSQGGLGL